MAITGTADFFLGDATGAVITDAAGAWILLYQTTLYVDDCQVTNLLPIDTTANMLELDTTANMLELDVTANLLEQDTTANLLPIDNVANLGC